MVVYMDTCTSQIYLDRSSSSLQEKNRQRHRWLVWQKMACILVWSGQVILCFALLWFSNWRQVQRSDLLAQPFMKERTVSPARLVKGNERQASTGSDCYQLKETAAERRLAHLNSKALVRPMWCYTCVRTSTTVPPTKIELVLKRTMKRER